jgi:hypothetical protein
MSNHTPSLAEVEIRLAKLERQNRRLKRLGLLFLLIAGSGFFLAQAPRKPPSAAPAPATPAATYDTLVVHRLELRDRAGKLRGLWSVKDGVPGLVLYDTAGNPRASLAVTADGPNLSLFDTAGKSRAQLAVTAAGPALRLADTAEKVRVGLAILADDAKLALFDTAGKNRATLAVGAEGSLVGLSDVTGELRAGLGVTADGPDLMLFNTAGKPGAVLDEDTFSVTDAQGFKAVVGVTETEVIKTGESHTTSAAAVTLFGKDGKVIWRAP